MHLMQLHALVGVALVGLSAAAPALEYSYSSDLIRRTLTPDNTCGGANGYTCDPSLAQGGPCCSANGYCGSASGYCGAGCQTGFSTSGACTTTTTGSTDTCGSNNGGLTCAAGLCCSPAGYCGDTAAYCGSGCQSGFGTCTVASATTPATAPTASPSGGTSTSTCGPSNGGLVCITGLCCSPAGYCGNSSAYCEDGCQTGYGTCTPSTGGGGDDSGLCGPTNGDAMCPSGQCCSPSGYCGTTEDYCADPDCLYQYGTCDSDTTPAGPTTLNDPRPLLGKVTYTDDIYDCVENNVVALSFDDGPYNYTSELLDVLQSYGFQATFFITGNNLGKGPIDVTAPYPSIISRMIADGHQVASHTWSHYSLQNISSEMRIQQMVKNERAIANIIGKYPTYMRPPYSQCDEASGCWADMQSLGYHRTYFDLDTTDYLNPLPSQIQNAKDVVYSALDGANSAGVTDWLSIQHDIVEQSVTNLTSYYLGLIKAKGWKGVTVGACLQDPVANWYRTPAASGVHTTTSTSSTKTTSTTSTTAKTTSTTAKTTSTTTAKTTVKTTSTTAHTTTKTTSTPAPKITKGVR